MCALCAAMASRDVARQWQAGVCCHATYSWQSRQPLPGLLQHVHEFAVLRKNTGSNAVAEAAEVCVGC